ncbi:MAG: class I SAM-dependent methyltransferase [Flavobacteriaceae bacterium]|jgi:O-methyltransferase involved in polyketide biosynthesis|nr:class I SAM-dependent methyltransferase [Flavobacteriaceae bacterium]
MAKKQNKNSKKLKKLGGLTGDKATLFLTLCAKAKDYHSEHSILHDEKAAKIVGRITADLSKFQGKNDLAVIVKSKQYDEWTKEFIENHENALVVHLGCGLDSRFHRVSPPSSVIWLDIDFPDVIRYRRRIYVEIPIEYRMYGASITDARWFQEIPFDRPTLIIAEGVLEYLDVEDVKKLFTRLTDYFYQGQLIFDVISPSAMKNRKKLNEEIGASHKWAVGNISEIDELNPKLKRITCISVFQSKYFNPSGFVKQLISIILSLIPSYRNTMRLLRYEFKDENV